jgi:hypothetical protein
VAVGTAFYLPNPLFAMVSFFALYHLLIQNTHYNVSFIPRMWLGVVLCNESILPQAGFLLSLCSHPYLRPVFQISAFFLSISVKYWRYIENVEFSLVVGQVKTFDNPWDSPIIDIRSLIQGK